MAVFDWVESASTKLDESPRVLKTQFGDGYAQRSPDGLNPIQQRWSVVFSAVDPVVGDAIIAFFRTHGGVTPFDWTPLWHTTARRFICPQWSRSQPNVWGQSDITASFEQDFAP